MNPVTPIISFEYNKKSSDRFSINDASDFGQ